jgi:hypothetical protein
MMAEDTIIAAWNVIPCTNGMEWAVGQGSRLITRADFLLQICEELHPKAQLTKNHDLDFLLGFYHGGQDAWTPPLTVAEALAAFRTTPDSTRGRRGRSAHVSSPVAIFARLVFDAVSKIIQEGNWSKPHRP